MLSISEATSGSALRRLNVLNRILNGTDNRAPFCFTRKSYSSTNENDPTKTSDDANKKTYVRIGKYILYN